MIDCFQFCFNLAFKSNLRRYNVGYQVTRRSVHDFVRNEQDHEYHGEAFIVLLFAILLATICAVLVGGANGDGA